MRSRIDRAPIGLGLWQRRIFRRVIRWVRWAWEAVVHPGRLSVRWTPRPWELRPMLDGWLVADVVTFDVRQGWIEVIARTPTGAIELPTSGDRLVTRLLRGRVAFARTRDRWPTRGFTLHGGQADGRSVAVPFGTRFLRIPVLKPGARRFDCVVYDLQDPRDATEIPVDDLQSSAQEQG